MDEFYAIIYETDVTSVPIETRANWIKQIYPKVKLIYAKNPPKQYGLDEESIKIQTDYLKEMTKGIKVTHFYNSEPYGKFVARDLQIEEVQVDRERQKYPISGTDIRNSIEQSKGNIEEIVYQDYIKSIATIHNK